MNITLVGFMGTGKTAVGKRLARKLDWRFVDVDGLIETKAKMPIARIFAEHGESVFRRLEKRVIYQAVQDYYQVIATGGGAFMNPESQRMLRAAGPVVCLTAAPKTIAQRVSHSAGTRPLLGGGNPLPKIQTLLAQRAPEYAKADLVVETDNLSVEQVVEKVWDAVGPWLCKSWQYVLKQSGKLTQRYGGKYIVVIDDKIVAVGSTQLKAYQAIKHPVPSDAEIGIYYIPLSEPPPITD